MNTSLLNNRYRVLKTLGRGGFSTTFLATDTHLPSGRQCVIKQLTPVSQDPEYWQWVQDRFQREAAILEQLGRNQEQIPQLFAYFAEAGNFYLVQEWIEGLTLNQKYQQTGTLAEDEVKDILISILPILDYVHSQRIIHRDLKPENIILRSQDNQPVLIDFGAVKEAMSTVVNPNSHSSLSVAIGTPGYMASEQAVGRPIYASDIYSLGLTAVYLLTGKIPQDLETDPRTGEFLWRRLVPDLHSNLATVIERAIRIHARDRFPNAREMLAALHSQDPGSTEATVVVSPPPSGKQTNQTAVTVPVSPGGSSTVNSTRATVAVNSPSNSTTSQPSNQKNGCVKILLGILLLGGFTGTALGFGVNYLVSQLRNREPNPTPTLESEVKPSPNSPPSPTPVESSPPPEELEEPEEPEVTPEPIASPSPTPKPPEVTPTPEPTVIAESPTPKPQPTLGENSNVKVPTFAIGTTDSQVKAVLGEPNSVGNGYLTNTEMLSYRNLAGGKVTVNYSFDRNTRELKQTQVIFAKSIGLEVIQQTLKELLGGNVPQSAQQGLEQVYSRQRDRQWIATDNVKGLIKRLRSDRLYLEVSTVNVR